MMENRERKVRKKKCDFSLFGWIEKREKRKWGG